MTSPIDRPPEVLAAMQRTREAAQQLECDALAFVCWLNAEFPGLVVSMEVQRHYSCEDHEIAHVEPRVTDRPRRHEVRDLAEMALEALAGPCGQRGAMSAQLSTAPRELRMLGWRPLIACSALCRSKALSRLIGLSRIARTDSLTGSSSCNGRLDLCSMPFIPVSAVFRLCLSVFLHLPSRREIRTDIVQQEYRHCDDHG
ncbi:hypothetical protein LVO79_21655 (plasmid) [Roseivivax marinus]|uniref:hypothetical protein n=1 Tax=Roseivivax marinus TaxID=1379903 RepID=UPI001F044316|nr:hypothetical protein [Roseivivax marinus]UMA67325.1 hypothetical protein LVO79_21655 [Roseivivax marinus]